MSHLNLHIKYSFATLIYNYRIDIKILNSPKNILIS